MYHKIPRMDRTLNIKHVFFIVDIEELLRWSVDPTVFGGFQDQSSVEQHNQIVWTTFQGFVSHNNTLSWKKQKIPEIKRDTCEFCWERTDFIYFLRSNMLIT